MISMDKTIIMDINKEDISIAIDKAKQLQFIDNLRIRKPTVQFDCKVRGYLGEIGISKWLQSYNIKCWPQVDSDRIQNPFQADIDLNIRGMQQDYLTEIKTSAKPDNWISADIHTDKVYIQECINKGDIKILAHPNRDYHDDLDRDIYLQIYFGVKTREHDAILNELYEQHPNFLTYNNDDLAHLLKLYDYIENIYFVAWKDKKSIIRDLDTANPNNRLYSTGDNRMFWTCHIKDAFIPIQLINFLKT